MPRLPIDYSKGLIYTITTDDGVYVGSTTNITKRKYSHKYRMSNENDKLYNLKLYKAMRASSSYEIKPYKLFPCNSNLELIIEEERVRKELNANLNMKACYDDGIKQRETKKAYRETHRAEIAKTTKAYRETHKVEIAKQQKAYYETHKDEITEKDKVEIAKQQKAYYETHKDEITEQQKAYRKTHKAEIAEKRKEKHTCEICGSIHNKGSKIRHMKTDKCQKAFAKTTLQ